MEYVDEKVFYHIKRPSRISSNSWSVGDIINIGDEFNNLTKSRYTDMYHVDINTNLVEMVRGMLLRGELSEHDKINLSNIEVTMREYIFKTKEYILELERLQINPDLPSRFNCLFVTDFVGLKYWEEKLGSKENQQIYKVKLRGKMHKANQKFVQIHTLGQKVTHEQAKQYWNGVDSSEEGYEYLFVGKVEVMEQMKG